MPAGPDMVREGNTCLDESLYAVRAILSASNPATLGSGFFTSDARDRSITRSLRECRKHTSNPCGVPGNVQWQLAPQNVPHFYDLC